jgi:hypothetical protein
MRSLLSLILLLAVTTLCHSADMDGGPFSMLLVKIDGEKLVSQTTTTITKNVVVAGPDGTTKNIPVKEDLTTTTSRDLKLIRATGNDDKDIATADLAKMLKDTTPVFFLQKPMSADLKAKFKRTAIFLEYTEPKTVEKK